MSGPRLPPKGAAAAAEYRDPKTRATRTGHGRAPNWIATAKNRDKFLVDESTEAVKAAPASKAKATGNYIPGSQPAMYRDPKSGATRSGRAPEPAWLAGAKDRAKFLMTAQQKSRRSHKRERPRKRLRANRRPKTAAVKTTVAKKVAG